MARVKGEHRTADPTPVKVPVVIDTVAPRVTLHRTVGGLVAKAEDMVAATKDVQLSWSINGGPFGPWGSQRTVAVPEGTEVKVRARDTVGNVGLASSALMHTYEPGDPEAPEVGGCSVSGGAGAGLTLLMLAALALVALRRRRD